eukprot:m.394784 g.394784  ORF g.394784 m.394784 type:complete len:448 (-) comp21092_c1_seq11:271-1614(-)
MKKLFFKSGRGPRPGSPTGASDVPLEEIPEPEELAKKLESVLDDLNLPVASRETIRGMPAKQQWEMVLSHNQSVAEAPEVGSTPTDYLQIIRRSLEASETDVNDERTNALHELAINLRTKTMRYVLQFIEADGLLQLLDMIAAMDYKGRQTEEHLNAIKCISSLMNNAHGLKCVLSHPNSITVIARSLHTSNIPTKTKVLEILGAVCLIPDGHRKVLSALDHFQIFAGERTRFQTVVAELARDTQLENVDVDCKTASLALINAIICAGPGQKNSTFRMHIRYEFIMLGLDPVIGTLRKYESEALEKHIRIFDDVYLDDIDAVNTRFGVDQIDSSNAVEMATLLADSLKQTPAYENLTSLLHHIVILPGDRRQRESRLKLLAEVAQQICIQEGGEDPDVRPLQLDVSKFVTHFMSREDVVAAKKERNRAMQKKEDYKVSMVVPADVSV